jgi:glutamine amidotransferase-like uncharacterized protein
MFEWEPDVNKFFYEHCQSLIWVQDFLWWWQQYDKSIEYIGINEQDFQNCDMLSFTNLRIYINPGGDAYSQLSAMGSTGAANLKAFLLRDQAIAPSAYVGFCAGGYLASHDYIWETVYEGPGYYNFESNPPLSLFPHSVEGSIFDINDDEFGDQNGSKFRPVNMSNGHVMLYYGGSTFGYNGVPAYADPRSEQYDASVQVLVYYSDFYGFNSVNIPAAWRYNNLLLTSVHPEVRMYCTSNAVTCEIYNV